MRCTVLGGGSWGTALATQLARQGHDTLLWERHADRAAYINTHHENPRYLKGLRLPETLRATSDLAAAVSQAELVVPVVPSHAFRAVLEAAASHFDDKTHVCCASKGLEEESLNTMWQVMTQVLPATVMGRTSLLYGPSFAKEVATDKPTAVVVAGPKTGTNVASLAFHGGTFRCYHSDDVMGVCIGGSLKNVMAIACGVSDGVGLGANARAALITRGLAEVTRLAVAMGANPLTMMGLAGMGDLVLTCTGNLSRNRRVGLGLGAGQSLNQILAELGEVAEGVRTTRSAHSLAASFGVELPITAQVYAMLYEQKPVALALQDLLGRDRRAELD
jgi:glycerol-3-phosphate dehydrogenase (NAD(P)+)